MKSLLILASIVTVISSFFYRITEMNRLKEEAARAYYQGDYLTASFIYQDLQRRYQNSDEKLLLNLSHALFLASKYGEAAFYYEKLRRSVDLKTRSVALNQLGVIAYNSGDEKLGLKYFRLAIVEDPDNLKAIYNFELLKKSENSADKQDREEQQAQPKGSGKKGRGKKIGSKSAGEDDTSNEAGENTTSQTQNGSGNINPEGENQGKNSLESRNTETGKKNNRTGDKTNEEIVSNRLKKFGITPAQAYQILEAMKREEIKYLQQLEHKSGKKNQDGPDY